jgi:hypothetical protein
VAESINSLFSLIFEYPYWLSCLYWVGTIHCSDHSLFFLKEDTDGDDKADVKEVVMERGWGKRAIQYGLNQITMDLRYRIYGALGYSGFSERWRRGRREAALRRGLYRIERTWKKWNSSKSMATIPTRVYWASMRQEGIVSAQPPAHRWPLRPYSTDWAVGSGADELKRARKDRYPLRCDSVTEKSAKSMSLAATPQRGQNLYARNFSSTQYWNRTALVADRPCMSYTRVHTQALVKRLQGWTGDGDGVKRI